jgi:hypothetical protein
MEDNSHQKIPTDQLYNTFELEGALVKLNRLSHFLEHEKFTRHDVFRRSIIINFHSYFLDNKYVIDSLIKRLNKKISLLNDIEFKIEDTDTQSYVRKIWDDIFLILDLFDEQISKTIRRMETGLNTDFKIDVEEYQKTHLIREVEKTERPSERQVRKGNSNDNSWLLDNDFSHDTT